MNHPNHQPWTSLVEAARRAPAGGDSAAPFGFATRVVALAMAVERPVASLFRRMSFKAMGVSCLLALIAVAANFSTLSHLFDKEAPQISDDPMTELADLGS